MQYERKSLLGLLGRQKRSPPLQNICSIHGSTSQQLPGYCLATATHCITSYINNCTPAAVQAGGLQAEPEVGLLDPFLLIISDSSILPLTFLSSNVEPTKDSDCIIAMYICGCYRRFLHNFAPTFIHMLYSNRPLMRCPHKFDLCCVSSASLWHPFNSGASCNFLLRRCKGLEPLLAWSQTAPEYTQLVSQYKKDI